MFYVMADNMMMVMLMLMLMKVTMKVMINMIRAKQLLGRTSALKRRWRNST